jgi:peroxiredoxin
MPALQRIYDNFSSNGVVILGVNATNQDTPENALLFTSTLGITFPILFDDGGSISQSYQVQSLPTTFLIDRNGIIDEVIIGGPVAEALLEVRIQSLLDKDFP